MYIEILGYILGLLVGMVMGVLGGGGFLLLLILLYVLRMEGDEATAYTTLLIGVTSAMGAISRWKSKEIDWLTVLTLGIPVSLGMLLCRGWLFDAVPDPLFTIGSLIVTKKKFVLVVLAVLAFLSFATLVGWLGKGLKPRPNFRQEKPATYYTLIISAGLLIGIIPGFTGAGGGVLMVPLMVVFLGIPMKTVIGTTLTIICAKSLIGFFGGDLLRSDFNIDWTFVISFAIVMIVGVISGSRLAHRMDGEKLKIAFGWFLLLVVAFIISKEFIFP